MRALAALLFLLPACSVWNRPDPPMDAPPPDAGDAGVDAFDVSLDALPDAPDTPPDAFVRPRESNCANTLDDDDDGLIDCADPDCASDARECCMPMGVPAIVNEDWCDGLLSSLWNGDARPSVVGANCRIEGAIDDRSMVYDRCVPLAAGVSIQVALSWSGPCTDCSTTLALSPVDRPGPSGLLETLALTLHEDAGELVMDLSRAGTRLGRIPSLSTMFVATLRLFPALDDSGNPVIRVTVEIGGDVELGPLDALAYPDDLSDESLGCEGTRGLFVGLATSGIAGRVGQLVVQPQECSNPNDFAPVGGRTATWLEATDLGFDGSASSAWTAGGIGSGAAVGLRVGGDIEWHYLFDGSNLNRANDGDRDLGFSIGGAFAPEPGIDTFTPRVSGGPVAGHEAPTCDGGPEPCGMYDFHDPTVLAPRRRDGSVTGTVTAVWSSRTDATHSTLVRDAFTSFTTLSELLSATPTVVPTGTCEQAAHPAILSVSETGPHLLVFTCDDEVWGMGIDNTFAPLFPAQRLITTESLGLPLGALDVDGAVFGGVYRLWVVGRDARGLTRVSLADGRIPPAAGDVPTFTSFGGNPVLSIDDPVFHAGPDACVGRCRITGIGVAREPGTVADWGSSVRVIVSVTDEAGATYRHALVLLEQTMR